MYSELVFAMQWLVFKFQFLRSTFGVRASLVASPSPVTSGNQDRMLIGIKYYVGSASYNSEWIENDSDLLDAAFVVLLRGSSESFVSKLLSGPSLAAEKHYQDENIVVQVQVFSRPMGHSSGSPTIHFAVLRS